MKKIFVLVLLLSSALGYAQQYEKKKEAAVRENVPLETFAEQQKVLWNEGWQFKDGADSTLGEWRTLTLPHDFQFEYPWTEDGGGARGFKRMGEAWYRKTFVADAQWKGKDVLVDFGGIMYLGDVYLNGHKIGSTEYGYVGIECNMSKYLHYDRENVLSVWASTGPVNGSRWYTGGGLFRDVYLKVQNPTHIARHGIYLNPTLPEGVEGNALLKISVEVDGFRKHSTEVVARVLSPEGKVIATVRDTMWQLTKHTTDELSLPEVTIESPQLWSPDSPTLYSVEVDVVADGILVDSQKDHFGIRSIEYDTNFGFKLNGKKVMLKGIANHHDLGALGAASYDDAIERQMRRLKEFGFNCIRCSHNPYSESFTEIADRVGMLIVDELIDKWSDTEYWGGRQPFTAIWPMLVKEWVKRDRNSPSVVLWSLGNELQHRAEWSGYDFNDWGITMYRMMNVVVKRYDATRPTTVAQFPARAGGIREEKEFKTYHVAPELACATEVASFNYQWDAYPGYYAHAPHLILFQSEAVTNQLQAPFYGMNRQRAVGLAYWGAIEYWGESNKWPKKGWNYSFFSHTLRPYPQAYLIKGAFMPDEPVVRIGVMTGGESVNWNDVKVGQKTYTESWNHREGSKKQVATFTNAEEVELLINGKSIGRQKNDTTDVFKRGIVTWQDVPYGRGGTLTAVAYNGGKEVARHSIETAGEAKKLVVREDYQGKTLRYLWIEATDSKGRTVPAYSDSITVSVEGAELMALDNGDHSTSDLFLPSPSITRSMREGRILVVLRNDGSQKPISVRATSGKLQIKQRL